MIVKHTLVSSDMRVFVLCSLMEIHRSEEAGARIKAVHPVCHCKRRCNLWAGTDDSASCKELTD